MTTRTIRRKWQVEGVLTDVTSAVLQDPTGTYGVKRNDTNAVVVASGTAMTHIGTGTYEYSFTEPAAGVPYTAWVRFTYAGNTYDFEHDLPASTEAGLGLTFGDLKEQVAHFLGWQRSGWTAKQIADLAAIAKSGFRNFYYPMPVEPGRPAHQWSFMRPNDTIWTVAPYATGTITVAAGVVTLASGTWPSWAAEGDLCIPSASSAVYSVASRDGDTQLTLDDTSVTQATAAVYNLGRYTYDLPTNFGGFTGPMTYAPGISQLWPPVELTNEGRIRRLRQQEVYSGGSRPYFVAYRPKAFVGSTGQRYEALFYPTPDAAYELSYPYKVLVQLPASDMELLLGGDAHAETILEACLALAEERFDDAKGSREHRDKLFPQRLMASVEEDRALGVPDSLGIGRDNSDVPDSSRRERYLDSNLIFTYNGLC